MARMKANEKSKMSKMSAAKRVTTVGALAALALIFSYVEALIPFNFGVPGIKLGLANLVVVTGLYYLSVWDVLAVSLIRILIAGLLFGNGVSIIYSLAGGLLSFVIMCAVKKTGAFSIVGVSVLGAVFHNVGQIAAACFVMKTAVIFYYLPILMIAAVATGFLLGFVSGRVLKILQKQLQH
ncbi:Gx transporter family protein [Ruminococcus sp.]|uniref:Gx transporter family protein n=1 Tax=Ruminococcus sp. TaxID=41978 RepID=UPI002600D840|nr:Gx transporter family protein [Ruminococcus sp.]